MKTIHTVLLLKKLHRANLVTRAKHRAHPQLLSTSATISFVHTSQHPPSFHHTNATRNHFFHLFSTLSPKPRDSSSTMDAAADNLAARFEEQASVQPKQPPSKGKNKGAGGGGGGGAEGGPGAAQKKQKDISRALSRLLRHQATNAGIQLDREGYAPLDKVVSLGSLLPPPFPFPYL